MLEPPRTLPREVEDAILDDDVATMQGNARVGVYAYVGFLAFMPFVWWIAPANSPHVLALSLLIILNMGVCWWGSRVNPLGKEGVIAVTNALLLAVVSRMYTPFLIAPALAAMSAMAITLTPTRSKLTSVGGMVVLPWLAVLGPFLLERFDVLSVTTTVDDRGVLLDAVAIAGDQTTTLAVAALYVLALIAAAAVWPTACERASARPSATSSSRPGSSASSCPRDAFHFLNSRPATGEDHWHPWGRSPLSRSRTRSTWPTAHARCAC